MPTAGAGDFSPDGKRLVYSPLFRDFRTWKRYEGGWAQDLYVYDLATDRGEAPSPSRSAPSATRCGSATRSTSSPTATARSTSTPTTSPHGGVEQLTHSDDLGRALADVGQRGHGSSTSWTASCRCSTSPREGRPGLAITVPNDGLATRPSRVPAPRRTSRTSSSRPKGERALFVARGDVFTRADREGPDPQPDRLLERPRQVGALVARRQQDRVRLRPHRRGAALARRPGRHGEAGAADHGGSRRCCYAPEWSPDGEAARVLRQGRQALRRDAGRQEGRRGRRRRATAAIRDYAWSPDGGHLAFSMSDAQRHPRRSHLERRRTASCTGSRTRSSTSTTPAWDPEGKLPLLPLATASSRRRSPRSSGTTPATARPASSPSPCARTCKNPFPPQSDEVTLEDEKKDEDEAGARSRRTKKDDKEGRSEGQDEGGRREEGEAGRGSTSTASPRGSSGSRSRPTTSTASRPRRTTCSTSTAGAPFYGRDRDAKPRLVIFDLEGARGVDARRATSTAGRSRATAQGARPAGGRATARATRSRRRRTKKTVSTKDLCVDRVPPRSGRRSSTRSGGATATSSTSATCTATTGRRSATRYRALLPYVAHRSDLNYVLGEMVAELNVGHAYIEGGDFEIPPRAEGRRCPGRASSSTRRPGATGSPGSSRARTRRSSTARRSPRSASTPESGDYVLAIDGEELSGQRQPLPAAAAQDRPGDPHRSTRSRPSRAPARSPTSRSRARTACSTSTGSTRNRAKVDEADGRARSATCTSPTWARPGIYEFIKWFYPQIRKEGLVVDVRSNGGGNVSQWIIERLDSKLLGTRFGGSRATTRAPTRTSSSPGHMACLLNETSASDGDIFPHLFRKAGLGPLIGKRSWGGVVGISGPGPLLDGGQVFVPAGRHQRRGRQLDHRGARRRPRHRGRERPGVGDRRPRPAARARRRGGR